MGLKVGICGAGAFARQLAPLFAAHPMVDEAAVADLIPERADRLASSLGVGRTLGSLEELVRLRRGRRGAVYPAPASRPPVGAGPPGGQARLQRRPHRPEPGRDTGDRGRGRRDGPRLHDGRDQLLLPQHPLLPGAVPPGRLRRLRVRRGPLPPRHDPLLPVLPPLRGQGVEARCRAASHALRDPQHQHGALRHRRQGRLRLLPGLRGQPRGRRLQPGSEPVGQPLQQRDGP